MGQNAHTGWDMGIFFEISKITFNVSLAYNTSQSVFKTLKKIWSVL